MRILALLFINMSVPQTTVTSPSPRSLLCGMNMKKSLPSGIVTGQLFGLLVCNQPWAVAPALWDGSRVGQSVGG